MTDDRTGDLTIDKFRRRRHDHLGELTSGKTRGEGAGVVGSDRAQMRRGGWAVPQVARWAGLMGFGLPAITLVAYPIWLFPGTQTAGADLARWAMDHHGRLVVTMLLDTVGVTCWFVFGIAVYALLRERLPAHSMLPMCFAASFMGCAILLLSGFTAFNLMLYRDHGPEVTVVLYDLTFGLLAMSGMPTVVALTSFAVAVYANRVLPGYTAHLALAGAVVHPVLLATFIIREGPLSLEGISITAMPAFLFAWILGTSLAMPRNAAGYEATSR